MKLLFNTKEYPQQCEKIYNLDSCGMVCNLTSHSRVNQQPQSVSALNWIIITQGMMSHVCTISHPKRVLRWKDGLQFELHTVNHLNLHFSSGWVLWWGLDRNSVFGISVIVSMFPTSRSCPQFLFYKFWYIDFKTRTYTSCVLRRFVIQTKPIWPIFLYQLPHFSLFWYIHLKRGVLNFRIIRTMFYAWIITLNISSTIDKFKPIVCYIANFISLSKLGRLMLEFQSF